MGYRPVGTESSDSHRMVPDMGGGNSRTRVLHRSCHLSEVLRQAAAIRPGNSAACPIRDTSPSAPAFAGGAHVPLDHGSLDADSAVHCLPSESRRPIQLGDLSLDRGHRADRVDSLSYLPCLILAGLLVYMARQNRND